MKEVFEVVRSNLQKALKDQGRYYNLRQREWWPALGLMVLLRQHQLFNAGELEPKFDGSYRATQFLSPNVVRLARAGNRKRKVANLFQIKPFYVEEEGTGGTPTKDDIKEGGNET